MKMREGSEEVTRGKEYLGVVKGIGQIRRILSYVFVRSQALCLLSRLSQLGPRACGAAERCSTSQGVAAARRGEMVAQWPANKRGRGLSSIGMIFVE